MIDLDFLDEIIAVQATPTQKKMSYTPPTESDFRLYKNGKLFANQTIIDEFGLQFSSKKGEEKAGNAIDFVPSEDMVNAANITDKFFIGFTPKKEPKSDLFDSCKFDSNGEPTGDVTKGGELEEEVTNRLFSLFGLENQDYLDFNLIRESEEKLAQRTKNIITLKKKVSRGEKKGNKEIVVRESSRFFLLNFAVK